MHAFLLNLLVAASAFEACAFEVQRNQRREVREALKGEVIALRGNLVLNSFLC